jgi:hypothetical protein
MLQMEFQQRFAITSGVATKIFCYKSRVGMYFFHLQVDLQLSIFQLQVALQLSFSLGVSFCPFTRSVVIEIFSCTNEIAIEFVAIEIFAIASQVATQISLVTSWDATEKKRA